MKNLLRLFLISTLSLWLVNQWFPNGLTIQGGIITLTKAGIGLTLANWLIRPIFTLIMLPINLLTFGMFRWVANALMLWLVMQFVQGMAIHAFKFPGINYADIIIPPINFNTLTAWIVIPFLLSFISGSILWLVKK